MLKNLKKKIAYILGHKVSYFKGKDKIIRYLYSPHKYKDIDSGEKFEIKYFDMKYQGITSNYIDWGVYFKGGLEAGLIKYMLKISKNYEYFFDIGANSGSVSLPFSKNKNLKIYCFEPLKYNYSKLINNYKINNIFERHNFYNLALSNTNGKEFIYYSKKYNNLGGATLDQKRDKNNLEKEEIYCDQLDNLIKFENKKIIVKIDVEGHEQKVIEGAKKFFSSNKIFLYLETESESILDFFFNLDYNIFYPEFIENKYSFSKKKINNEVILANHYINQ